MNSSSISLDWQIRQVGDLDGDRKSDLVWTNSTTGEAAIWLMEGSTMRSGQIIAAGLGLQLTYSGDLDGDGKTDLVWRNPTNGDVLLWLMDGLTRRSAQTFQVGTAWQVQTVADVNGDNRADLIWRSVSSNEAAVWIMNGTTVTQADFLPTVSGAWTGGVRRGRLNGAISIDEAGNAIATAFNISDAINGFGRYEGRISSTDPQDFYRFTLPSAREFVASLGAWGTGTEIQLVRSDGQVIQDSRDAEFGEIVAELDPGTYYIRVYSNSLNTPSKYTIHLSSYDTYLGGEETGFDIGIMSLLNQSESTFTQAQTSLQFQLPNCRVSRYLTSIPPRDVQRG